MIAMKTKLPFRVGTTSYIILADILPNAQFLADKVDDIELVLFEVDDGSNNLPEDNVIDELNCLAVRHDLTFTVHLPLDLQFGLDENAREQSLQKASRVIERMGRLDPFAYVLHLDGRSVRTQYLSQEWKQWNRRTRFSLDELAARVAAHPTRLAVENLDGYPPDFWDVVLQGAPVSRCVDIGHLWYEGHDPLPYLQKHIARTRVIHMHGYAERDHQSLAHVPGEKLEKVLAFLIRANFRGVLTLEVFGEDDFQSSMDALDQVIEHLKVE